ncbi:MAG: ABC transporter permease [Clostridiales bacterium]|jgi:simple sugar transport system permease protein|nr:ABC transporter permease [Clostridiales bacterium]
MEINKRLHRMTRKTEFYIFLVLIAACILIQIMSGGQLFEPNSIVDIARSMIVIGMFALINLAVVISGGFDLSFPTLASLSYCTATNICLAFGWCQENAWMGFILSGIFGLLLGMVNGIIISRFKLNTMLVTLGTQTLFLSISIGLLEQPEITSTLPLGLRYFGESYLFEVFGSSGMRSVFPTAFLLFLGLAIIVWFVLNHTMFGRSLYAIGGNEISAERAGINVKRVKFWLYAFVGCAAGITGMTRVCLARQAIPKALVGWEMTVIPAVILGGASIYGGEGSVFGTLTAVGLITMISNSLLLIGIDSYWQEFFNGIVILIGVTVSALQARRRRI